MYNRHRLTSNFDVHVTLMDLVHENRAHTYASPGATKGECAQRTNTAIQNIATICTGESLFTRISPTRICQSAGISAQFCTCTEEQTNTSQLLNESMNLQNTILAALQKWAREVNCSEVIFDEQLITFHHISAWTVSRLVS
jgi:hypothetical protein